MLSIAHCTKQRASQIFRYAISTGRTERDPTADLRGALVPVVVTNHTAITEPTKSASYSAPLMLYRGQPATGAAFKLAPLVFVRPSELRAAKWEEFTLDSDEPQWRISAERMKMRERYIVPLSSQAVAILKELLPVTGPQGCGLPFPA